MVFEPVSRNRIKIQQKPSSQAPLRFLQYSQTHAGGGSNMAFPMTRPSALTDQKGERLTDALKGAVGIKLFR